MNCELSVADLVKRGPTVIDMLGPLIGATRPAYERQTERMTQIYLATHTGPRPISNRRDWRFATLSPNISGAYLERWLPTDERATIYHLDRSYLHLYLKRGIENSEEEIIGLHCDPNEPNDADAYIHSRYKRGPHVHVKTSHTEISHSHIALNLMDLDSVLCSVDAITDAMRSGIQMLRDQVIDIL